MQLDSALVWFRRDLRVADHAALYHALTSARRVYCAFVFDRAILDALPSRADRRVEFIHACLVELDAGLRKHGGALIVLVANWQAPGTSAPRVAREAHEDRQS